jgi:antirestriction protein ArdC
MRTFDEGITAVLEGEAFMRYLAAMGRFHGYSVGNVALILAQAPEATRVAGYRTWQSLGRQVRKGEQGIRILVPHTRRVELEGGEEETVVRSFGVGTVFDIRQTEGDPLPEPPIAEELRTASDAGRRLAIYTERFLHADGIPVERVPEPVPGRPAAKGCWSPRERIIRVKDDLAVDQAAKTLVHETAHAVAELHGWHARHDAETVAEGAAYVVLSHFGIDSGRYSFPYIAAWAEDREILTRNLAGVQQTAHTIITGIEAIEPIESFEMHASNPSVRGGEAP